jgi:hypothetical protein
LNYREDNDISKKLRREMANDFTEFLKGLYGQADNEELALFRELLAEIEGEEIS